MDIKSLNENITKILNEFYPVEAGESLNMSLTLMGTNKDGSKTFQLDGIEFVQGIDEDLQNAIEVCLDEEFLPEWDNISSYTIEYIDYVDGEDDGYVGVMVEE